MWEGEQLRADAQRGPWETCHGGKRLGRVISWSGWSEDDERQDLSMKADLSERTQ